MQLRAAPLLAKLDQQLLTTRRRLTQTPGLALIWVGDDSQSGIFVRAKQQKAKILNCNFFLHHFENSSTSHLLALIKGLNSKKEVQGIVLQLPLPKTIDTPALIKSIDPVKDVDNLGKNSPYDDPTPSGIIKLLEANGVNLAKIRIAILGAGQLVGRPLAQIFQKNNWSFSQFKSNAAAKVSEIVKHDLLISATGVPNLVNKTMVHQNMIVVDGSGVDVEVKTIEPLVKMITPKRGAVGPLTVSLLFQNLFRAARRLEK